MAANKFNRGEKVLVTRRNGETVSGTINNWDYNICTFEVEYSIDYLHENGKIFTVISVPQTAITRI